MNSIELASNRDKAKSPQPAPEGPPLRVFLKEGTAYTLQLETTDFQHAMKHAAKLYGKGKDILVNEKDNPNIVHAKSNLHKDVDVGREIKPADKAGVYVKGTGQVVLAGFYQKLPMSFQAYDDRERAKVEDPAMKARPATSEVEVKGNKVILDKTGYQVPETVLGTYTILDGKYNDKVSNALRFEDHGKKLSTPVEDRAVIADMIAVAAAKNWGQLELRGTETFKQMAWLEAESRGIQTKGYKPNERDLEQLDRLKQERGAQIQDRSKNEKVASEAPAKDTKAPNEVLAVTRVLSPDEKMRADVASRVLDKELSKYPEHVRKDILARVSTAMEKGDVKLPTPKVTERTVDAKPAPAPTMDRSR